jgi:hypothetical protein
MVSTGWTGIPAIIAEKPPKHAIAASFKNDLSLFYVNFSAISAGFAYSVTGDVPESHSPSIDYELKIIKPAPTAPTAAAIALKLESGQFSSFSIFYFFSYYGIFSSCCLSTV